MSVSFIADPGGSLAGDATSIPDAEVSANTVGNDLAGSDTDTVEFKPDISQLSPFVEFHALHQLLQTDPARYQQVTQQIATNLRSGAEVLQGNGDTTSANRLNQLAADFGLASRLGEFPSIEGLSQAVAGEHGDDLISQSTSAEGNSTSSESPSDSKNNVNWLSTQYLATVPEDGTQGDSQTLQGIILSTLSSAGINISNS
jgi:hypothetical protein